MNAEEKQARFTRSTPWRRVFGSLRWMGRGLVILLVVYPLAVWGYFEFFNSRSRSPAPRPAVAKAKALLPHPDEIPEDRAIRVLSVDGGGVKGLLPLHLLKALEERSGRPVSELFDFMVGTSTGGIIVSSLATPGENGAAKWSAADLINAYQVLSEKTFFVPWPHRILTVNGLVGAKLESNRLDRFLREHYVDARMSQLLTAVAIPSFDLENNEPELFRSRQLPSEKLMDYWVSDVISGITAAPVYFRPAKVSDVDRGRERTITDASLFENNPVLLGLHEALVVYPHHRSVIVSLGTGDPRGFTAAYTTRYWGLFQWAKALLPVAFKGHSVISDWNLRKLQSRPHSPVLAYYRFNQDLDPSIDRWFFTGPAQIEQLNAMGSLMVDSNQEALDELVPILIDPTLSNVEERVRIGGSTTQKVPTLKLEGGT